MVLKPCICVFVYLCICVFSCETLANIDSDILVTLAFQKYSTCHVYQHFFPRTVFVYLCICVFVFVYFDVRHLGTLFLRSSNNILFKNIAHDRSISKFYPNCICVFVYLCICICVFGYPRLLSDQLELFVTSPFSSTFSLGHSKWPKKCWKHFPIEQVLFYISPCNSCGSPYGHMTTV